MNQETNPPRDWTTQELADAAGVDQSRIRQVVLYGALKGIAYKRAGRHFIPYEAGLAWLKVRRESARQKK